MKKFRGTPAIIIILQILGLTFMAYYIIDIGLSKPHNIESMSEKALETVRWLQENTAPDEYILSDNTNINIMAERRGPFAEISIDRMDLGRLTSKMLIRSLYDYQIRVVVVTGRQFDTYKALDDFMDFIKENYTKVEAGYRIYVRDSPLSYRIFSRQLSAVLSSACGPQILAGFN